MTIRDGVSQVKKMLREVNADSRLSNRFVWSRLVSKASLIIQRESDKLRLSNVQGMYQVLKCVNVKEVPAIDIGCSISSDAVLYRTLQKIPDVFFDSDGPIFRSIRSLDGKRDITITTLDSINRWAEDSYSRYDKTVYAYYEEGFLYLTKKVPVRIEGLFITDVSQWCGCECDDEEKPCLRFMDTRWYVPERLEDVIIGLTVQDIANGFKRFPEEQVIDKQDRT